MPLLLNGAKCVLAFDDDDDGRVRKELALTEAAVGDCTTALANLLREAAIADCVVEIVLPAALVLLVVNELLFAVGDDNPYPDDVTEVVNLGDARVRKALEEVLLVFNEDEPVTVLLTGDE